jgi:site-specific recombinase XerD
MATGVPQPAWLPAPSDPLPVLRSANGSARGGAHDWRAALARLDGAYSEHTLRGYRSDFARFAAWCGNLDRTALPASAETVAAFVAHRAPACSPATLRRCLAGIRKLHRLFRLPNPAADEEVLLALRRALRSKPGRRSRPVA